MTYAVPSVAPNTPTSTSYLYFAFRVDCRNNRAFVWLVPKQDNSHEAPRRRGSACTFASLNMANNAIQRLTREVFKPTAAQ